MAHLSFHSAFTSSSPKVPIAADGTTHLTNEAQIVGALPDPSLWHSPHPIRKGCLFCLPDRGRTTTGISLAGLSPLSSLLCSHPCQDPWS